MIYGSWISTSQFSGCGWAWIDGLGKIQLLETHKLRRRKAALHTEVKAMRWPLRACFNIQHAKAFEWSIRI